MNDTHLGITKPAALNRCFERLKKEDIDIIVHAGDYCGGRYAHKTLGLTIRMLRTIFPTIPIMTVLGNHDFYTKTPTQLSFNKNYELIKTIFKTHHIHFLDEDGIFRHQGISIIGCSGWYHERPDSNDWNFIPNDIEGDTHSYFQKRSYQLLDKNLSQLTDEDKFRIYVSHFPVIDCNPWDGNPHTGEILEKEFNIHFFISGHSHARKNGPKHFRSRSDYYCPDYELLNIIKT